MKSDWTFDKIRCEKAFRDILAGIHAKD